MGDDAGRFLVELPLAIDPGTSALAAGLEASAEAAARTAPEAAPPVASTPAPVSGRPAPTEPEVDGEPEAPDPEGPAVAVAEPESDPGPSPEEIFALTCGDPDAARTLLASGLASDPAGRLEALFRPAGGADQATLQETLEALQGVGPIRVEVRTAGNEPVANGCRWLMEVDFLWTNAFGQPRSRNVRLRMELEAPEGAPAIRALSGIS